MKEIDYEQVRKIVMDHLPKSGLHGIDHTDSVVEFAKKIAKKECPENYYDVVVGAYLHDIGRECDKFNLEHGPRGAKIAEKIIEDHWPWLEKDKIIEAIRFHSHGRISNDKIIGSIWDADRLDLTRVRKKVDWGFLSTETGKELASI